VRIVCELELLWYNYSKREAFLDPAALFAAKYALILKSSDSFDASDVDAMPKRSSSRSPVAEGFSLAELTFARAG
jgi:hypothetical protein